MKTKNGFNIKKLVLLVISILAYVAIVNFPTPEGLTLEGKKAIALMITAVFVWATEVIPVAIASVILPMLVGILGISTVNEALANFMNSTIIFMFAAQLIAAAFTHSGVGERVSLKLSFLFGNRPNRVLLSFMLFTCVISMFLVDIPTAIIFASIAYMILKDNNMEPGTSNFGRSVMIGIPIAAALGGFGTPVGSGLNILTVNLLAKHTGVMINFWQWSMLGIPTALILTLIAWKIIQLLFPPEVSIIRGSENVEERMRDLGALKAPEKKFIVVFLITVLFWITQPVTKIDNTLVAAIAAGVFAFTGIDLIDWSHARTFVGWEGLFLVGGATAVAMTLMTTGASKWIGDLLAQNLGGMNALLVIFIVIVVGILSHIPLPVGGAMVALMVPIIAQVAQQIGINPIYLVLPLGFTVSCVFLIPLDPIPLATQNYGYWKMSDMVKAGVLVSVAWIVVLTIIMILAYIVGLY